MRVTGRWARWVSTITALALALPMSGAMVAFTASPAAAAEPIITLTKEGPAQILVGGEATYTLTAANPSGADQVPQYNLAFRDVLPLGVSYTGPTTPAGAGEPTVTVIKPDPADEATWYEVLVWPNVADLQVGSTYEISFKVTAASAPLPVSSSFVNAGSAFTNADPRYEPKFTSAGSVVAGSYTATADASTGSTGVTAFRIDKSVAPAPEDELVRGVHDNVATYTLEITNNPTYGTDDIEIRDYLPAGLEFLGCGAVDNSTSTALYPNGREYPTAPSLDQTPTVTDCLVPVSVETVENPPADAGRTFPPGVYAKVTWRLGDLDASEVDTITYRAGIPQRANTMSWQDAPAPDVTGGGTIATQPPQTANLDNNTGASTRETAVEQSLTNVVAGSGAYLGPVPGQPADQPVPVTSSTSHTVLAEDLAMVKSVSPETFVAGDLATYTLHLRTSEYVTASDIVVTDVLPNGTCPVWSTADDPTVTGVLPSDCGSGLGASPTGATLSAVTANDDGTFTLVFAPVSAGHDADLVITYQSMMRTAYTGGSLAGDPTSAGDDFTNTVSLTGTTDVRPAVDAPAPTGSESVTDASAATQQSVDPAISKLIKPNVSATAGYQCAAGTGEFTPGDPVSSAGAAEYVDPETTDLTDAQITFSTGSVVCFLLRVSFPTQAKTRNPVITDFLPEGTSYVAGSAVATANSTVDLPAGSLEVLSDSVVRWSPGTTVGADRFVSAGGLFEVVFAARVDTAVPGTVPDIVGNLMKFRSENSAGQAVSLRDRLDFQIAPRPMVSLVKGIASIVGVQGGVTTVNPTPAAAANIDGRSVRDGDVVKFRIDVTNTSNTLDPAYQSSVQALQVWDLLPAGATCAAVSSPNYPTSFTCLDPSDPGYPTSLASTGRSLLQWQFAPGSPDALAPGETRTLTYDFTVPDYVSVGVTLTDDAGVRSFQSPTNVPGQPASFYPADNIDPEVCGTAGTPECNVAAADDPSNVVVLNVALTKTGTTSITENNNNLATQATIGEQVTYTVTATVPYGTSVYRGVLTDALPTGLTYVSSAAELSTDGGATFSSTLPVGTVLAQSGQNVTLTLPTTYTAAASASTDHVFRVTITARVSTVAGNSQGVTRTNRVTFASRTADSPTAPTVPAPAAKTYSVTIVEPSPSLTKVASPAQDVVVGQVITYTLTAGNLAGRPPLHNSWVVDCVPAGITFIGFGSPTLGSTQNLGTGITTYGCAADQTTLLWSPTSPDPAPPAAPLSSGTLLAGTGNAATLTYTASVSDQAAGLNAYTNTARLTGGTLDDAGQTSPTSPANPNERTYSVSANATITVEGGAVAKSVTPTAATIGESATWTITATLPAKVNFYAASVIDQVEPGIDLSTLTTDSVSCVDAASAACTVGTGMLTNAAGPGGSTLVGWYLGDIGQSDQVRTVTITYSARVADLSPTSPARGDALKDTAKLVWNSSSTTTPPTSAGATFDRSSDPATATLTVLEPSVGIAKAVSTTTPAPGEEFTYTVTVTNSSAVNVSTAYAVAVADQVPSGVVVKAATISGGGSLSGADATTGGGTITWPAITSLAPGGSVQFTYTAVLAPSASLTSAGKTNTVAVTGYDSLPTGGRHYPGPQTTATVTPALPKVTPAKSTPNGSVAYLGTPFTWQVTLTNTGASRAYGVDALDTLPPNWQFTAMVSAQIAGVSVAVPPAPVLGTSGSQQTLTWTDLGDLDPTQSVVLTFTATPQQAAATTPGAGASVSHVNTVATTAEDATGAQGDATGPYNAGPATAVARIHSADLTLSKSHVGTAVAGSSLDWTITVGNDGPDTAVGPFTVTDSIASPMSLASATGTGWTCSTSGADLTCTRTNAADTLASGASFPDITVTVTIPSDTATPTELSNTAEVSGGTYDPDPENNTDTDTTTLTASADLAVVKATSGPIVAGRDLTYTLDVSNLGPSTSRGTITVTDPLPTGTTFVSASGSGWVCPAAGADVSEITCTRAADLLAASAAPQIVVVVHLGSAATGSVVNTATVTGPTPDPVSENNTSTVTDEVTTSADVAISKTHGGTGDFTPGTSTNTYTFTVTNDGPSVAVSPVTVTDVLPEHLSWTGEATDVSGSWTCSADPSSAPVAPDRQTLTCTLTGDLAPGQTREVRIGVAVSTTAPAEGSFTNTATVDTGTPDPNPANNTSTDSTDFTASADLAIAKTPASQDVVAGETASWALEVTNSGPSDSVGPTTVTDVLPAGTTFVSASGSGWGTCAVTGQVITCVNPSGVAAHGSLPQITLTARVAADAGPATLVNLAGVTGPTPDPDPTDNQATASIAVSDSADLAVVKSVTGADPVAAGGSTSFSLAVSNAGPSDADDVVVSDELPAGLTFDSATGSGWTCSASGQLVTCTRPSLAADATAPLIELTVHVESGFLGDEIDNTATMSSATTDPNPEDNESTSTVGVTRSADLTLTKTHDEDTPAIAGGELVFTLTVTNDGPSDAAGPIVVDDTLPAGLSLVSNGPGWTCTTAGTPAVDQTVECTLDGTDPLLAGSTAPVLTLTTAVAADVDPGDLTNSAVVTGGTPDPDEENNTDTDTVEITTLADLVVTKTHSAPATVGESLAFTIEVTNAGPSQARSVQVVDPLPEGLAFVSASGGGWTCTSADQDLTCTLDAPLAPAATAEPITVIAMVTPAAFPGVTNTAVTSTVTPESDLDNNTATDPVTVPALVDLVLDKSHTGDFTVGQTGTYTFTVSNEGPTADPGPQTIADVLPGGLEFVSAEGTDWTCQADGADLTCEHTGALAVAESTSVSVVVAVGPDAAPSVVNTATVSTPSAETTTENNTDSDLTGVIPVSVLTITKDVADQDGKQVEYLITVGNEGPSPTSAPIVVTDPMPTGLTLVSVSGDGWECAGETVVTCTFSAVLPVGGTAAITLVAKITADPGDEVVNVASVVSGGSNGTVSDDASVTAPEAGGGSGDDSDGDLAHTGSDVVGLLGLALILFVVGGVMIRRGRLE